MATDPDAIKTRDLTVISGVAADKVLASERVEIVDKSGYVSALDKLGDRLAENGQTLELTLSIGPVNPRAGEVIDVTSSSNMRARDV